LLDNAFTEIGDFERAQGPADDWPVEQLHRRLGEFAQRYCPVIRSLGVTYHWNLALFMKLRRVPISPTDVPPATVFYDHTSTRRVASGQFLIQTGREVSKASPLEEKPTLPFSLKGLQH